MSVGSGGRIETQAVLSLRQMKIAKQWAFGDSFVFIVSSGWLCLGPSQEVPTLQRAIVAFTYLKQQLCGLLVGFWTSTLKSWARAWLCISSDNEEAVALAIGFHKARQSRDGTTLVAEGVL